MRARISRGYDVAGKYYKLAIDIDLSSSKSWLISSTFAGHFDGQGHTITVDPNKGIFRYVNTPSSRDIAIINLNVKTPSTQDVMSSGYSIVYRLLSGVIENCTFTGNVSSDAAGGIAYRVDDGFIRNCSFSGTVQADSYAGGIVARLAGEGGIENCKVGSEVKVSISKIASAKYAGGIVGRMTGGYVKGCTSYAKITGTDGIGGIVGCISKVVNRSRITGNTYTGVDREVGYGTGYFDPDQDPNPTPEYDPDSRDNNLQPQDNTQHDGGGGGGCTSITLSGFSLLLLAGLVLQKSRRH